MVLSEDALNEGMTIDQGELVALAQTLVCHPRSPTALFESDPQAQTFLCNLVFFLPDTGQEAVTRGRAYLHPNELQHVAKTSAALPGADATSAGSEGEGFAADR